MFFRVLSIAFLIACVSALAEDLDRDTLDDDHEQRLLERFAPRFLIASGDCDIEPSSFKAGVTDPEPGPRDGTLYGQVFPSGDFIEIHYYHLWARDCGRNAHPLDVEHVSVLIDRQTERTRYWYAAAHSGTLCDAGHGATAQHLPDTPLIWVSRDKHASFLSETRCQGGCGGDECALTRQWTVRRIVNVGERNVPLNGSLWIASRKWEFASKMDSQFPAAARVELEEYEGIVEVQAVRGSIRSTIGAGNTTVGALGTADRHTRSAMGTATRRTRRWLGRAAPPSKP